MSRDKLRGCGLRQDGFCGLVKKWQTCHHLLYQSEQLALRQPGHNKQYRGGNELKGQLVQTWALHKCRWAPLMSIQCHNYHNIVVLVTKYSSIFSFLRGQAYQFFCTKASCVTVPGWEVPAVLREVRENFATSPFLLLFHLLQRRVCLMARILSPPKIEKDNNTKYEIKIQEKPSVNTEQYDLFLLDTPNSI